GPCKILLLGYVHRHLPPPAFRGLPPRSATGPLFTSGGEAPQKGGAKRKTVPSLYSILPDSARWSHAFISRYLATPYWTAQRRVFGGPMRHYGETTLPNHRAGSVVVQRRLTTLRAIHANPLASSHQPADVITLRPADAASHGFVPAADPKQHRHRYKLRDH